MEAQPFTIRHPEAADAADLAALLRAQGTFAYFRALAPDAQVEHVGRHLAMCQAADSHSLWVAEEASGQVVGYVAVHWLPYLFLAGPEGYVSELFVHPGRAGRGIGTALLERASDEAKARGCARLSLINFRDRESYQRGFYARRGWKERPDAANFVYFFPPELPRADSDGSPDTCPRDAR